MTDRETTQSTSHPAFAVAHIPVALLHEVATALVRRADYYHGQASRVTAAGMDDHRRSLTQTALSLESLANFMRDQWSVKFQEMYPGYEAQNEQCPEARGEPSHD